MEFIGLLPALFGAYLGYLSNKRFSDNPKHNKETFVIVFILILICF